jgi:hypothetical protein
MGTITEPPAIMSMITVMGNAMILVMEKGRSIEMETMTSPEN